MTHEEVERDDIVDRYVRRDLDAAVSAAFEEHFFACDACFDAVRAADGLQGAVKAAAADGLLDTAGDGARFSATRWMWLPMAASLALAAIVSWQQLVTIPVLRKQLAAAESRPGAAGSFTTATLELPADLPIAMLASVRGDGDVPSVTVPESAPLVVVWIEGRAAQGRAGASLTVLGADGARVQTVSALRRNASGAYVTALASRRLVPGVYRLRLNDSDPSSTLIGEYALRIAR